MAHSVSALKPYKSLLIGRIREDAALPPTVNDVLDDVVEIVEGDEATSLRHRADARRSGELVVGFVHYEDQRPVAWTSDDAVVDRLQQLVLVCRRAREVAIYASDTQFRRSLALRFGDPDAMDGLGVIEAVPSGTLNAAFVRGATRTLWLSGTHRRTTVKADSKILSGIDLRDALDPLDDQSYYFSAARSFVDGVGIPVGVTPRRSSVWAGATREWDDFRGTVEALLQRVQAVTEPERTPLPVLASATVDVSDIVGAFDVSLQPPELLADDPTIDVKTREELERWGLRARFEIIDVEGPDFRCNVHLDGNVLGTLDVQVDLSNPERMRLKVDGQPASPATADLHRDAMRHCGKPHWLKIRYDSGHTISDGVAFEVRFRDVPFINFRWVDLDGFEVDREKPIPLSATGTQTSLFDWTQNFWPNLDQDTALAGGWLACDDGAMEIADFIHLDDVSDPPVLTLVHVKGANSASTQRQVSVSAYEIVVGQAVKNLRYLDRVLLAEGLAEGIGRHVGDLVWHDRMHTTRQEMIAALQAIGTDYERHVVVFQPHVTRSRHQQARSSAGTSEHARLQQLDALLLGADADAHALNARFSVLADNS